MRGRIKKKWAWFGGTALAVVALAAIMVVPALGSHNDLTLEAGTSSPLQFNDGATLQPIANGSKGCEIAAPVGSLVSMTSSNRGPGLVSGAIGVKSGGSNGTPCSFTEFKSKEWLRLDSLTTPWESMELDVELKDNAWVRVTFIGGTADGEVHELVTGASIEAATNETPSDMTFPYGAETNTLHPVAACASPSDSGPDSGANDNCRWALIPDGTYQGFKIETLEGAVSLEAGLDDTEELKASVFYYADYQAVPDEFTTDEDTPATWNVMDNDGVAGSVSFSGIGSLPVTPDVSGDGGFTFDPTGLYDYLAPGESETESFTYSATVDGQIDSAGVDVIVNGVNDAPKVISGGAVITTTEDQTSSPTAIAEDVDNGDMPSLLSCQGTDPLESGARAGQIPIYDGTDLVGYVYEASGPLSGVLYVVFEPVKQDYNTALLEFDCLVGDSNGSTPVTISVDLTVNADNDPPTGDPDSYSMEDRSAADPSSPNSITRDVVANDDDVDSPNTALTVSSVDTAGTLGSVTFSGRNVTYMADFAWPDGVFQLEDTFTYIVTDGEDPAVSPTTVTVTVSRVQCADETVSDTETVGADTVFGSFTLLSPGICKPYSVVASATSQTVDFTPGGGTTVAFYGQLSGNAKGINTNGFLEAGLYYDIDLDGPGEPVVVVGCNGTSGNGSGFDIDLSAPIPVGGAPSSIDPAVVAAVMPAGHTWCIARTVASSSSGGSFDLVYEIVGLEDPRFTIR
jgi:hypothetical protein